jgi:hypothetical protein
MTNGPEKRLIDALRKVDVHGDVAPPHVHDPMIMVLRESAIQSSPGVPCEGAQLAHLGGVHQPCEFSIAKAT